MAFESDANGSHGEGSVTDRREAATSYFVFTKQASCTTKVQGWSYKMASRFVIHFVNRFRAIVLILVVIL